MGDFRQDVTHIILVNAGVKLACEGSDKAAVPAMLEESGIEILSFGTCLNHFNIKDRIKSGQISNMFSIVDVMTAARKVFTI